MSDAIVLEGVGKRYWKVQERAMLLRSLLPFARPAREEFWAVRGMDLRIGAGETVGILGHNGAGKTTLLRMLAGVSQPSEGHLRVVGRIAPLISVGVGFHKEMSGRENVLLNGMLLGLTEEEVRERFDDIVAFAELGDFIDTPVKFYSSGMFMRLGFAVAIHTDPDIMLVDEVLAVGDAAFQAKCFDRMRGLQDRGTTIVLVTHSLHAVRLLCERAVLVRRGHLEFDGAVEEGISEYHRMLTEVAAEGDGRGPLPGATILGRALVGPDGPVHYAEPGTPLRVRMRVRFNHDVDDPVFALSVQALDGRVAYGWHSPGRHGERTFRAGDETDVDLEFTPNLVGGSYQLVLGIAKSDAKTMLATDPAGPVFYVAPRPDSWGLADLGASVSLSASTPTGRGR